MTLLERIDNLRKLAEAEQNGKTLEFGVDKGAHLEWVRMNYTVADRATYILEYPNRYRIKPDRIKPESVTRPWTEEEVPLGGEVKFKSGRFSGMRGIITSSGIGRVRVGDSSMTLSELLASATLADGSPCGVTE